MIFIKRMLQNLRFHLKIVLYLLAGAKVTYKTRDDNVAILN